MAHSGTVKCSYYGCNNTYKHCDYSFFKFPVKDNKILKVWVKNCGNPELVNSEKLNYRKICEVHFNQTDVYISGKRKLLRKSAVPFVYSQSARQGK